MLQEATWLRDVARSVIQFDRPSPRIEDLIELFPDYSPQQQDLYNLGFCRVVERSRADLPGLAVIFRERGDEVEDLVGVARAMDDALPPTLAMALAEIGVR